jgi:hypothetical protein
MFFKYSEPLKQSIWSAYLVKSLSVDAVLFVLKTENLRRVVESRSVCLYGPFSYLIIVLKDNYFKIICYLFDI